MFVQAKQAPVDAQSSVRLMQELTNLYLVQSRTNPSINSAGIGRRYSVTLTLLWRDAIFLVQRPDIVTGREVR